jgi:hypothetical protein
VTRSDSAICRHGALGAQLLCSLCVPSVIYRRLAAAHSIYPERLPPPHRCAVRRLARAQAPRPKMRQVAPLPRLHTELPRPPPVGAPCCAMSQHVCRHASRKNNSPAGHGWPDPLCRRQESPAKRRHAPAPVQVSKGVGKERSSWSDRPESVLACGFSGPCQQPRLVPEPAPGWWTGISCCCAAVFCCCTRASNCGLRISNLSL